MRIYLASIVEFASDVLFEASSAIDMLAQIIGGFNDD